MQTVEVVTEDGDELQWATGADRMGECGDAVEQASGRAGEHEHELLRTDCIDATGAELIAS